jgi:predicted secreted protein
MIISNNDAGTKIELQVGDVVQIQLTGTPTTGYWWHFQSLDEKYVEIINEYTKPYTASGGVQKEMDGGPMLGVWQLRAKKAGTTTVRMAYYRSWEDEDKAKRKFYITVQIN